MAAIIRDNYKVNTLKNFINSISTNSIYLGIGRSQYWDVISAVDTTIPVPFNTEYDINLDWADMLALKRITASDVSIGIFRENWQSNVKYDTYRHDWNGTRTAVYNGPNAAATQPASIADVKCVVVTASYNIYVCLKQQIINDVVQPSIYSPETGVAVGTNTGIVKTADGYYWKFLAGTSSADFLKFASTYYMPIKTLNVAPAPADPYYTQWLNQGYSTSLKGGIYIINTLLAGTGYNGGIAGTRAVTNAETDAEFKVIGDGTGLQYTVTYGSGGSILGIEVTNPGTGYTHATISATGGVGASFDIIYTSMQGLGADPVRNITARYLLVSMTLTGNEGGDFPTANDFRKVVLVQNPLDYGASSIALSSTLMATQIVNVGTGLGSGAYPVDAVITGGTSGAKGRVVEFDTVTGDIRVIRTLSENSGQVGANNSFQVGEALTSSPGTGGGTIVALTNPDVQPHSGEILYSENKAPVNRGPSQSEDIKLVVKF